MADERYDIEARIFLRTEAANRAAAALGATLRKTSRQADGMSKTLMSMETRQARALQSMRDNAWARALGTQRKQDARLARAMDASTSVQEARRARIFEMGLRAREADEKASVRRRIASRNAMLQGGVSAAAFPMAAAGGMATYGAGRLFGAGAQLIGQQVGAAAAYHSDIEQMQLGLTAILAKTENVPYAQAGQQIEGVWQRLETDAIKTVATTRDLFSIFSQIAGPIRRSGKEMSDVFDITTNTVHAAAALGVDMPQATRDIGMMMRGRARSDVKLYKSLLEGGFIQEIPEVFNKLSAFERAEVLQKALSQFEEMGKKAEQTLLGRTSSFQDIAEIMREQVAAGPFQKVADIIGVINDKIIENRDEVKSYFQSIGNKLKTSLEPWEKLVKRITSDEGINWGTVAGTAARAGGGVMGGAAGAFGGGIVGGGAGSLLGIALSPFLGPMAPLLGGGLGSIAGAAGGGVLGAIFGADFVTNTEEVMASLAKFIEALMKLGGSFERLLPKVEGVNSPFARFIDLMTSFVESIESIVGKLEEHLVWFHESGLGKAFGLVNPIASKMNDWGGAIKNRWDTDMSMVPASTLAEWEGGGGGMSISNEEAGMSQVGDWDAWKKGGSKTTPDKRATNVYDFRNSTFHQDFKEANPDRVIQVFKSDMEKQASARVQSPYGAPFPV